jgi:hypothetical protein
MTGASGAAPNTGGAYTTPKLHVANTDFSYKAGAEYRSRPM